MHGTSGRILIVDDEPSLLRMMSLYLGRLGYTVTVANSLAKARAEWTSAAEGFSVVVLDATLGGGTLDEFSTEVLSGDPRASLIAASGYPVDMSELDAMAPGRVAFLHKPFSPEMLAAAVRRMLGTQEKNL